MADLEKLPHNDGDTESGWVRASVVKGLSLPLFTQLPGNDRISAGEPLLLRSLSFRLFVLRARLR